MNLVEKIVTKEYNDLTLDEKILLHKLYDEKKSIKDDIYLKLRKIIFRIEPPTPEGYLNSRNGWLPKDVIDQTYPHIKEDFIEILNEEKNYNQVVEYGAVRLGKSTLARMLIHYIIIYIHCLRHPQLFYGLSPLTNLSIYIMSFVAEKANQLLLKPIYDILTISPRFIKVDRQDSVPIKQKQVGLGKIVWSKAATFGKITLESKLSLNIGTDFMSFIGADLLFLVVSEINFFIEKGGASHDQIFQLYSDGLARIKATIGNNFLGMVFLDSSANDSENPIENYILHDIQKQKNVFFRQRSKWINEPVRKAIGTEKLPIWENTGETFKVCIGDDNTSAKIITKEAELKRIPPNLIIEVPIDLKENFERNIIKSIKDDIGLPTKLENKLIHNKKIIENIFNNKILRNIEGIVIADASSPPENLIWDQISNTFFSDTGINRSVIYRAPTEPRYVGIDTAYSLKGDVMGFSMTHKEWWREKNRIIYIIDFCFVIGGKEKGINIDSSYFFIIDIQNKGHIGINSVYSDTFQSESLKQNLERKNIPVIKHSVDREIEPYQFFLTCLSNEIIKGGKNIFLKNNLFSLIRKKVKEKEKIDHSPGKTHNRYFGDWKHSLCGINAKDCSDAVLQSLIAARNHEYTPSTIYEEENKKWSNKEEDHEFLIEKAMNKLHKMGTFY